MVPGRLHRRYGGKVDPEQEEPNARSAEQSDQPPALGLKRRSTKARPPKAGASTRKPQDAAINAGPRKPDRQRREHQPKANQVSAVNTTQVVSGDVLRAAAEE